MMHHISQPGTAFADSVGFAEDGEDGGGAAVFTMSGESCRRIDQWSRFGRERELLYGLNSKHIVVAVLDEEQAQLIGKADLQLFTLQEVSDLDAAALHCRKCIAVVAERAAADMAAAEALVKQFFHIAELLQQA
eukprot:gene16261-4126_t